VVCKFAGTFHGISENFSLQDVAKTGLFNGSGTGQHQIIKPKVQKWEVASPRT
jgi:hypothetical protein